MKAKVNIPKRGNSNPPLKNLPPSALLEEQTKKMEQRLKELKDVMADQAAKRETLGSGSGTRWQSANQNMPIKNYAETVLKSNPKQVPKGTVQKPTRNISSREKVPPLSGSTVTTPSGTVNLSQKNKENESQKDFFKTNVTSTSTSVANSAAKTLPKTQKTQPEEEKTIENNLNRALSKQKGETNEVDKFLEEIGLTQYSERFKENGFDDLETLMDAQTKHFVDMKIPAGHQIKLSKRIEQLKQSTRPAEKIILPNQKVDTKPANQINMDQIRTSKTANEYVSLEEPTKEQGIGDDKPRGGELLQGAYNEAESHKSFQEALNEWRSGKPAEQPQPTGSAGGSRKNNNRPKDSREKKVRFAEPKEEKGKDDSDETEYISSKGTKKKEAPKVEKQDDKKSFFFSGGSSWNQAEMPVQKETETGMSPREAQVSQKAKVSCWHCYRLVADEEVKNCGQKQFCSDECVKNYKDLNSAQCLKKGCGNKFLKEEGIMREGRWYCSEKCAPSMEEILMEEQRLLKRIEKEERGGSRGSEGNSARSGQGKEDSDENVEGPLEIDLSVAVTNKKQVLTLAELEEKYKNLNKLAEKAEEGDNEFEDSLS